jgi:DNA-binding NarL/FixJ family response regulator
MTLSQVVESLCHRRSVGAASLEGVVAIGERASACGLAIIDVNLGAGVASGVDVLTWLRRNGFSGKAVFLTGHARTHPDVQRAEALEGVVVLSKPVPIHTLLELLECAP